jgi:hypothetical protein
VSFVDVRASALLPQVFGESRSESVVLTAEHDAGDIAREILTEQIVLLKEILKVVFRQSTRVTRLKDLTVLSTHKWGTGNRAEREEREISGAQNSRAGESGVPRTGAVR